VNRRLATRLLFLAAGIGIAILLGKKWPQQQTVHFVLGDASARVTELEVHYARIESGAKRGDSFDVGATFPFGSRGAPRIVTHEPKLAEGDYTVAIEIATAGDRAILERRITLDGHVVSVDVERAVPAQ
jgi:hypothetical protein